MTTANEATAAGTIGAKMTATLVLILLCNIFTLRGTCAAGTIDGYLILGQSNACGRSHNTEFGDHSLAMPYDDGIFYAFRERSYTTGEEWDTSLGALRAHSGSSGGGRVGAEITLGRRLAEWSDADVLLLTFCSSGTRVSNFLPNVQNLYQPMIEFTAEMEIELGPVNWQAIFVITGESDRMQENSLFQGRVATIRQALADDLGATTLVFARLKSNLAGNFSDGNEGAAAINAAIQQWAAEELSVEVTVSNDDLDTRDDVHYTSDAYAVLGNRLFTSFAGLPISSDLDGDGLVSLRDLAVGKDRLVAANIVRNLGVRVGPNLAASAAVPEPSTLTLAALGLIGCAVRWRRGRR